MEITVIWSAEEGKPLKTICSSEIKRDHAQAQPHSLCCRGKEKASAVTRAIWRKIDFQTGVPAYSNQRTEMEWEIRQGVRVSGRDWGAAAQISSPPPPSPLTFCIKVVTSGREFLGFCVMSLRFGARGGKRAVKAAVERG